MSSWKDDFGEVAINMIEKIIAEKGFTDFDVKSSPASNKGDNYLGVLKRIEVSGKNKDEDKPKFSLVLKICPSYTRKMPIEYIYKRELFVYTVMLPTYRAMEIETNVPEDLRLKFTACHGGDMTYMGEFFILDDLKPEGFVMSSRKESLSFLQVVLLMKSLANVHALSFALKQRQPEKYEEFTQAVLEQDEFGELFKGFLDASVSSATGMMTNKVYRNKVENFTVGLYEKMLALLQPDLFKPYTVLVHGDCWINNVMFRFKNGKPVEVRLLDWQMVKHASPIVDLAYLIFSSTDESLRSKHYDEFLDIYYKHLGECLERLECDVNVCYPEDVFKDQIQRVMPFGLIMAIITAPMFMCEDDDIPDMDELMKKEEIKGEDFQLKNKKSQSRYENRINGVVRDFMKLEMI